MEFYAFKILLVGDSGAGKTCLLSKYTEGTFPDLPTVTIGVDFKTKTLIINEKCVKLQIWDTAGLERFKSIIMGYYKNARGVILVFDLTNINSFINIKKLLNEIMQHNLGNLRENCDASEIEDPCIILVGTKSDLPYKKISDTEISDFCRENQIRYIETSAKNGINVETIFIEMAKMLIEKNSFPSIEIDTKIDNKINEKCCYIL